MFDSKQRRFYYGWWMLGVAAAAMVGTLPGRTQGLGLITEPLLADLQIDRVTYAALNFWTTIVGAAAAVGVGRLIDVFGSRFVLTGLAAGLGTVVCVMSQVVSVPALAICLTLTRALGQSALSVVSIAMVGQWFVRRIHTAMAIYSVTLSIGFMLAFPLVGTAVQTWGWRAAWAMVGAAIAGGLAPVAWLMVRRSPEALGLTPDGAVSSTETVRSNDPPEDVSGYTWDRALTTSTFWIFALGAALYGLVASGIGLFNESILAERGFGPAVYYQSLVAAAMAGLVGNFLGGWVAVRMPLGRLMALSLGVLAGGLATLPQVSVRWQVMMWAGAMGLGGGLVMVLFFAVWPRLFGRRHLGRIQGVAQAATVLASAVGPLLLAWCLELTGSYTAMFRILAAVIALVASAAWLDTPPPPWPGASDGRCPADSGRR